MTEYNHYTQQELKALCEILPTNGPLTLRADQLKLCKLAIEKQISNEPKYEQVEYGKGGGIIDGEWFYHCPDCHAILDDMLENPNYKNCPMCGKAISRKEV